MKLMGITPITNKVNKTIRLNKSKDSRENIKYNDRILAKTNGKCWLCGEDILYKSQFSRDHKIPLSKGGSNKFNNLFPAHIKCNNLKGNMIINTTEEFLSIFKPNWFIKQNPLKQE
jgi:5-methylcytosine-specific restriction endonuclease McrA